MIVRIMGEGQLRVDDGDLDELNRLDDELGEAIESGDDESFRSALIALLDAVRSAGTKVPDDELVHSDLVLPYEDAHVDDVRAMLTEDGLIPG
ncbi:MAG: PspA-associated protein PspAA [Actinomycetota bacterium]